MPTYEYKCTACGHRFERFQNMNDPALSECEICTGRVKRLIGAGAGIIFRGSGFYETDYKRTEQNKNNGAKKAANSENSSGTEKKADTATEGSAAKTSGAGSGNTADA